MSLSAVIAGMPQQFSGSLMRTLRSTLMLLYPPACIACQEYLPEWDGRTFLCASCQATLQRLVPPWCARCGEPLTNNMVDLCVRCATHEVPFDRLRSFGLYEGILADLVLAFKFEGERALVRQLADYLFEATDAEMREQAEAITFVPMTARAVRIRGFNQAELLARRLGRLLSKPTISALRKVRETHPQVELNAQERLANLKAAFSARKDSRYEKILLVDDVYTTGATLAECSRALRAAGYEEIYALTLARASLEPEIPDDCD